LPDELPSALTHLNLGGSLVKRIPNLPPNLCILACEDTEVKDLPVNLPNSLAHLYIMRTKITVLPVLPKSLKTIYTNGAPLKMPWPRWPDAPVTFAEYNIRTKYIREEWLSSARAHDRCRTIKEELMAKMWSPECVKCMSEEDWHCLETV
jgi:hypothetical protein